MAQSAGTFDTYGQVGIREDLENVIFNVTPEDTPFQSMIGSQRVRNTFHEWQTDALAAATTNNAQVEGFEYTYTDPTATTRVGNYAQIMSKTSQVSKTADAVNTAGRARESAYQIVKRGRELKRDRERILLANQASFAGYSTAARTMGGFPAWLETNARRGTGGADGGYNGTTKVVDAATDSTTAMRTFTETLLKDMLQDVYINSDSSPRYLLMHPKQKRTFSGFTGISDLRHDADSSGRRQAAIIAGADRYLSDWGMLTVAVDRFQRARDVFAVNPEYLSRGVLRPMSQVNPAEDSDARKTVLVCEETLIVKNEAAHGVLADLNS